MSTLIRTESEEDVRHVPIDEAYLQWLYSHVGSVKLKNRTKTYWSLLRILHSKEFVWDPRRMGRDENRAKDGIDLRRKFLEESGAVVDDAAWLDYGCSFLELLIALSWQMSFEGGGTQAECFWEIIGNLGLRECTDAAVPDEDAINYILDKVNARDYAPNGAGGLFPLKDPDAADQRNVELWYQLNTYLLERL